MNQIIVTSGAVSEVVPNVMAAAQPESQWVTAGLGRLWNTDSGQTITAQTALTYSSVWQATSLISQAVAGLPLEVYARDADDDREKLRLHPAYPLLNVSPAVDSDITAFSFKETLQAHALTWGNGYAEIERNNGGRPVSLSILAPSNTFPDVDEDGMLFYWTNTDRRDEMRQIMPRNMLHIKGLSNDGLIGYSVFEFARNSWGLGLAAEKHGNRHFRNNSRPNIALKTDAHLNEDQATSLRERFEDRHRGLNAESSTAVLSGGLDIVPFSISNEDSQWLQSRQFQRQEVASWFNVPPHMLGDSSTTGYNSIQEENRRFLQQTLMPWLRKWTSECDLKLLDTNERRGKATWWEHSLASLIEADFEAVTRQVTQLVGAELMTPNEARRKLNLNRRADGRGDDFRNPSLANGVAVESAGEESEQVADGPSPQNLIDTFNVYGTGGRAGAITPQEGDEQYFRELANLPGVSAAVAGTWREEPTRRPVTLAAPPADMPAPAAPAAAEAPVAAVDREPFKRLLEHRLQHLQSVEMKQVIAAAKRRKVNFATWSESWFDDWQERVRQSLEPIAGVWQAVGLQFSAEHVASEAISKSEKRAAELHSSTPRSAFPIALEELYLEDLGDWPQELAAMTLNAFTDKEATDHVENP